MVVVVNIGSWLSEIGYSVLGKKEEKEEGRKEEGFKTDGAQVAALLLVLATVSWSPAVGFFALKVVITPRMPFTEVC